MGSRCIIARPRGDGGWEGVYVHNGGGPSRLGAALWAAYHGTFQRDHEALLRDAIDAHRLGWSSYPDEPYRAEDGYENDLLWVYPDEDPISNNDTHLSIEQVYVIHRLGMDVLTSRPRAEPARYYQARADPETKAVTWTTYESAGFEHVHLGLIAWDKPEPDWAGLDAECRRLYQEGKTKVPPEYNHEYL